MIIIQPLQRVIDGKWVMTSRSDESSAPPFALGSAYDTEAECVAAHTPARLCSNCIYMRGDPDDQMHCGFPAPRIFHAREHIRKSPHPVNAWENAYCDTVAEDCPQFIAKEAWAEKEAAK